MRSSLPSPRAFAVALGVGFALAVATAHAQDAASAATVRSRAEAALQGAQQLASFALSLLGVDYKWGGTRPETGLDCSGLVQYVFQQVTGVALPRTAQQMSRLGSRVGPNELKPGDLVFFNTRRFAFSHVGIYLGGNRFIHAPSPGREVEIAEFDAGYWKKRFNGARRLESIVPELLAPLVSEAVAASAQPPAESDVDAFDP